MHNKVKQAKDELNGLSKETGLKTITIRRLSAKLFRSLEDKNIDNVFSVCEEFLEQHDWAMGVIAFDWANRVQEQYNEYTFDIFESWLIKYVRGWGDCDDFCTHAFGVLLIQDHQLFDRIFKWTNHSDFWMRRAAAVILIPSIFHDRYHMFDPFRISDALMQDQNDLVLKGYGWMLKILSTKEKDKVYEYLLKNKNIMPRTAFRYALEKMDRNDKEQLMKK